MGGGLARLGIIPEVQVGVHMAVPLASVSASLMTPTAPSLSALTPSLLHPLTPPPSQGPPGTGKTHTVWGMLNALHLVQYQEYFRARLRHLAPSAADGGGSERISSVSGTSRSGGSDLDALLQNMDGLVNGGRKGPRKPRMLVCAPSNAAVDELLTRVLTKGFLDGEMRSYRPAVARVGAEPASAAAQVRGK